MQGVLPPVGITLLPEGVPHTLPLLTSLLLWLLMLLLPILLDPAMEYCEGSDMLFPLFALLMVSIPAPTT